MSVQDKEYQDLHSDAVCFHFWFIVPSPWVAAGLIADTNRRRTQRFRSWLPGLRPSPQHPFGRLPTPTSIYNSLVSAPAYI